MTHIYTTVNETAFHDAFINMNRKENFCYEGRQALFEYLEDYAENTDKPVQLDVIALCCEFSEYENIEEFNNERGSDHEDWEEVADETTVIPFGNESAIVLNY